MPTIRNRQVFTNYWPDNKSKNWLINATNIITQKIDKMRTACKGYNKIQPRILARSVTSMLPNSSTSMVDDTNYYDQFTPSLGSKKIKRSKTCYIAHKYK